MSNLICTLTGDQYRAACACRASKDVRYYLDSIFISSEHKELVATNGHILYTSPIDDLPDDCKDLIIDTAKIPANVESVTI